MSTDKTRAEGTSAERVTTGRSTNGRAPRPARRSDDTNGTAATSATPATGRASTRPAARDIAAEQLWFRARQSPWRSLALVPLGPSTAAVEVFERLCAAASLNSGMTIDALRGDLLTPKDVVRAARMVHDSVNEGNLVLVLTDPPSQNPSAITLAREVDAAMLLITLSRTTKAEVQDAVEVIGEQRVVGAVSLKSLSGRRSSR